MKIWRYAYGNVDEDVDVDVDVFGNQCKIITCMHKKVWSSHNINLENQLNISYITKYI